MDGCRTECETGGEGNHNLWLQSGVAQPKTCSFHCKQQSKTMDRTACRGRDSRRLHSNAPAGVPTPYRISAWRFPFMHTAWKIRIASVESKMTCTPPSHLP